MDVFRKQLSSKVNDIEEYSSSILLDRLTQRLGEIGLPVYTLEIYKQKDLRGVESALDIEKVKCPLATLNFKTGDITFTVPQWIRNQFDFASHWLICLIALTFPAAKTKYSGPASLMFGVGGEGTFGENGDKEFVQYCREGPIEILHKSRRVIVQSAAAHYVDEQSAFQYSRQPVLSLLRGAKIGLCARAGTIIGHIKLFYRYFKLILQIPELSLLGRDLAYSFAIYSFDQAKKIDSVIFTNSNFLRQPIWSQTLRNGFSCMVWNSQNFKPILYKYDLRASDVPGVRWIRVDEHLVWTVAFSDYLQSLGLSNIKKIDPVLWYLPKIKSVNNDSIKITVFDISPYSDETAFFYGEVPNYNGPKNLSLFIHDVVNLRARLQNIFSIPVLLILKSKRGYKSAYDLAYFEHLKDLEEKGMITLEHHRENMYSLISGSDVSIVYPFSSPAYVADYVGVPSIYYDPTGSIVGHNFGDGGSLIKFANSPNTLFSASLEALKNSAKKDYLD